MASLNAGSCTSSSPSVTGTVNVYVQWVNTSGTSWSTPNKNLVKTLINDLTSTPYWGILSTYDTGFGTTTMSVVGECTQVNNSSPVSGTGVFSSFINPPCNFPNVAAGNVYMYLPADTSIVLTNAGAGGEHTSAGVVVALERSSTNPSPNGNGPLDAQLSIITHELFETLTDPNTINGWLCGIGQNPPTNNEVADVCQQGFGGGPWLGNVGGQPYNLSVGGNDYYVSPIWVGALSTANGCFTQVPDTSHVGTFGIVSPNGWQYQSVSGGWNAIPNCNDGQKDGFETDVDCGGNCPAYQVTGPLSPPSFGLCASGKRCQYFTDCNSGVCTSGVCN